jgi:hypothetical protein
VTDKCFNSAASGTCINEERNFMFVNLIDASGNIRAFDQIVVGSEIDDSTYDKLTIISGTTRNSFRFKPSIRLELNRSSDNINLIRQFLGPPLIVNYRLYETNLIAVDIQTREYSGTTRIKDNTRTGSDWLRVNAFDASGSSAKVYYYDLYKSNDLGKNDSFPSSNYSDLYLRKRNAGVLEYYRIISSTVSGEFNNAKTVWKVQSGNQDEYIFVNLRVNTDTRRIDLTANRGTNFVGSVGKIDKWESDDIITVA